MKRLFASVLAAVGLMGSGAVTPAAAQNTQYVGQLMGIGFNFCPQGWATAAGQILPISSHDALFSLLGCTYGGDCRTTFALPDLRGRSVVGVGSGPGLGPVTWGQPSGVENVTLTVPTMPNHTHAASLKAADVASNTTSPTGAALAQGGAYAGRTTPAVDLAGGSVQTSNTGGGIDFNARNPFLGMSVCIAEVGIYPSRS